MIDNFRDSITNFFDLNEFNKDFFKIELNSSILSLILKLNSVTNSAAAVGVGARMSAIKSLIVKSISCPTPDIVGIGNVEISRANSSLLKHHKSSIDPPPLAKITTSILLSALDSLKWIILFIAFISVRGALSP